MALAIAAMLAVPVHAQTYDPAFPVAPDIPEVLIAGNS
jgi:hypothetical protein